MTDQSAPRVWTVFLMMFSAVAAMLIMGIFTGGGMAAYYAMQGTELADLEALLLTSPAFFFMSLIATQASIISVSLLGAFLSPESIKARLSLRPVSIPAWHWIILVFGSIGSGSILGPFLAEDSAYAQEMIDLLTNQSLSYGVLIMIFGSILPGLGEEFLCRGYIQTRLLQRWSPITAIALSSFFFALLHMDALYILMTLPIGLWLGWVHYRYQSIIPTIICHFFNNLFSFSISCIRHFY